MTPFRQPAFAELPELPRVPHRFFDLEPRQIAVKPRWFGHGRPGGSINLVYRVCGAGPPLLLVHGLMTTGYSWRYVLDRFPGFTLYIPDLVGAGRSDKPDSLYAPDRVAEVISDFIDALEIRGCAAIGNSMGGYLLMRLALRDGTAMSRLSVLHAPGLRTPRMTALRAALRWLPRSESLLRALVGRDPERWVHRNVHYYDESLKSLEECREYAAPLRTEAGLHALWRTLKETLDPGDMDRFEMELRERGFPIPVQLVYARRDPMVPPSVGERLRAWMPTAEWVWLEEASHFAHVDATDAFVAAVDPFIRR